MTRTTELALRSAELRAKRDALDAAEAKLAAIEPLLELAKTAVAWEWPGIVGTPEGKWVDISTAHAAAVAFIDAYRILHPTEDQP